MFCHKQDYSKIEKTQYRALKIAVYSNESYEELPLCNNEVSIYQKHLCIFPTEIFKSLWNITPDFMKLNFYSKRKYPTAYEMNMF